MGDVRKNQIITFAELVELAAPGATCTAWVELEELEEFVVEIELTRARLALTLAKFATEAAVLDSVWGTDTEGSKNKSKLINSRIWNL